MTRLKMNLSQKGKPRPETTGEKHGLSRLTEDQVREIRHRYASGTVTQKILAKTYGVYKQQIMNITLGWAWKHIAPAYRESQETACASSPPTSRPTTRRCAPSGKRQRPSEISSPTSSDRDGTNALRRTGS